MLMDSAQPKIPKMVDLMKLGANRAQDFRSEERRSSGMANGMAAEATDV